MSDGREVEVTDREPKYDSPKLTLLGSVHAVTQGIPKTWGNSDGYTFMGNSITNASP